MSSFFKKLISNSNEVSSRRFIAILLLPSYIVGIFVGIFSKTFNFYLTAMISAGLPILMAFFLLTWEHVKGIVKELGFNKKHQTQFFDDTTYVDTESKFPVPVDDNNGAIVE